MNCEQVNHGGGGNPGIKGLSYAHEAQSTDEREEVPMRNALPLKGSLPVEHSLQFKAAEYWLKLGEADEALRALEALPSRFWSHVWAIKTRIAAMGMLRGRDEMTVQA